MEGDKLSWKIFRKVVVQGLIRNNCYVQESGFRPYWVASIEKNRSCSRATLRILLLRRGKRWSEDGIHKSKSYFVRVPECREGLK